MPFFLEQTNTKDLKNSSCYQFQYCYKKVKISYEAAMLAAVSLIESFILFSKILTEVALEQSISSNATKNSVHHGHFNWPSPQISEHLF